MVTEEQLAAYADDELSGEEKARLEEAIEADPALNAKVEKHRALKTQLSAHFAPVFDEKVPDHLAAMLKTASEDMQADTAQVVSFAKERQKRGLAQSLRRWAPIAGPAMAACLVVAIIQPWQSASLIDGYADGELANVLDTQLTSTQSANPDQRILLSFEDADGEFCRAYQTGREGGIACRDDQGWAIECSFALEESQATEFRQAGSLSDIMAAAQEMAQGDALDAAAEAKAKAQGWQK
jgi:hypothetical protein